MLTGASEVLAGWLQLTATDASTKSKRNLNNRMEIVLREKKKHSKSDYLPHTGHPEALIEYQAGGFA